MKELNDENELYFINNEKLSRLYIRRRKTIHRVK